jgi:energy-coupling factor transport system substrate-specific component
MNDFAGPTASTDRLDAGSTGWRRPWRVVDIVVASVLAVVGGVVFAIWNATYGPASTALAVFPPATALIVGVWLFPGVLGGLVIRRPGAAVYTELVAALVSALIGNQWGFTTVWYGALEGLGAEVVFLLVLYRRFDLAVALGAGAGAGIACGILDDVFYNAGMTTTYLVAYVAFAAVSGLVIAGLGSWALTRALARTGALAPLASGRAAERV